MIKLKDHHRTTIPFASVNRKWCWIVSVRYCGHLSGFRLIYQPPCFSWGERSIELYSIKVSLKAPPFPWHVGAAVKRVIVTPCPRLERTHRPNCLCHRPCLAVKYWAWRHRPSRRETRVLWERVGGHVNVERGGFLLGMVDLLRSLYPIPMISI